ncbi:MAG: lytic transglycosylase domain-containing protein [Deltaproteobacteria bacterium]|nr:MAG: lytic transglycosylase domain-containing protein [Deltaproteobacteria bacterium]
MTSRISIAILAAASMLLLSGISPARADIYRYVDENGVVHFTNAPQLTARPNKQTWNFYRKELRPGKALAGGNLLPQSYRDIIRQNARAYQLEEALVKAVIKAESNYNPQSLSNKGAQGLMQLIPETARLMNVDDPFDPAENIRGGSNYLRLMLDRFNGNLDLALAAYNAGPNAVQRHGGIPPYEETRNYVQRVRRYLEQYRRSGDSVL